MFHYEYVLKSSTTPQVKLFDPRDNLKSLECCYRQQPTYELFSSQNSDSNPVPHKINDPY